MAGHDHVLRVLRVLLLVATVTMSAAQAFAQHADELAALNTETVSLLNLGRLADAGTAAERSLALAEKRHGPSHPAVALSLHNLSAVRQAQGRNTDAEPIARRALAIREATLGAAHPDVAHTLNTLSLILHGQGRFGDAERALRRTLDIREKALGPDHPDVGITLNNLAGLYQSLGRLRDAEPLYVRALANTEKALGPDHSDVGIRLSNLAFLYGSERRFAEAEGLYKRALVIAEKTLEPDHFDFGIRLNNLADIYHAQRRYADAEPLYQRALANAEKAFGPDHASVARRLNNLAALYADQGRRRDAEAAYRRSLAITEKALGPNHPDVANRLNNLAELFRIEGRFAEAEPLFRRALSVMQEAFGPDHADVAVILNNLAFVYMGQAKWRTAVDHARLASAATSRRTIRDLSAPQAATGNRTEAGRHNVHFVGLVKSAHRLQAETPGLAIELAGETFAAAQWAQTSQAAASLAQMAARNAARDGALASLVRERQDLVAEWQQRHGARIAAASLPAHQRDPKREAAEAARLTAIDARIAAIDARLSEDFPDHAALSSPSPLSLQQVQDELGANEAVVLFLDTPGLGPTPEETFVWVVTRTAVQWHRSELGTGLLAREVAALRCGLDGTAWYGDGASRCRSLLGLPQDKSLGAGEALPFDHARAHKVYQSLFGPAQNLIDGKHLLIVPSGSLTQLPFQVLVNRPPKRDDHRTAAWLVRGHPITILPAVSSLRALRRLAKPSAASLPMIGFGNPLLDGPDSTYAGQAQLARATRRCPEPREGQVGLNGATVAVARRSLSAVIARRGGIVDQSRLRTMTPLPETADELCAVARQLGATPDQVRLGADATEASIKALSASGALARYRVVHFATHGLLAGQLDGAQEPGLVLTPPAEASDRDDGYLNATEIAALNLDADMVVLSACNTAGGSAANAEALSGLARAFIYAQARSLFVSHWEVDSEATVKLITSTVGVLSKEPSVGRAEALRRAMLAMIDTGQPKQSHPAYWAPFVVVGEGAGAR